ncbi:LacI family DNA-binding transcriptional regulator [Actinopolyspora mortivallis]|uniref:LacI family DNA-binding transcriptional regulator n=1 Tax=Actinopolyspora mortivallis TaxID=33906 RepID=UPI00036F9A88|nr:LacI family DNA-binding transcriptional regulator [Actinopolyspora mortivallis]
MTSPGRTRAAGRPTLEQVAAEAGVSRGTVSRVVNGSLEVSTNTLHAVREAIDKLGYVPNQAARNLVTKRTDTVLLVVSEAEERVFGEPFFGGLVRGLGEELGRTNLQLSLMLAGSDRQRERVERFARDGRVDGAVLISLHGADPLPGKLVAADIPVVLTGRPLSSGSGMPFVDADNLSGAETATDHLFRIGCRRIATITGPQDMAAGVDRLAGYRAALEFRRGGAGLVAHGDFGRASGERAMRELLERDDTIDGVFAASDLMAAGAMRVLREHGRRVPHDVAVVGFDDSDVARNTDPAMTSVSQPVRRMGNELARLLVTRIEQPDSVPGPVILPTGLVHRDSA